MPGVDNLNFVNMYYILLSLSLAAQFSPLLLPSGRLFHSYLFSAIWVPVFTYCHFYVVHQFFRWSSKISRCSLQYMFCPSYINLPDDVSHPSPFQSNNAFYRILYFRTSSYFFVPDRIGIFLSIARYVVRSGCLIWSKIVFANIGDYGKIRFNSTNHFGSYSKTRTGVEIFVMGTIWVTREELEWSSHHVYVYASRANTSWTRWLLGMKSELPRKTSYRKTCLPHLYTVNSE